ncbi:hypothetical protein BVRB_3g050310 [Beta vulgaris subsp. vulgaris]|nr:hypothetical protein BVRB_3g050310 [Beta vulgaris subsp. vulgaris]
MLEVQFVDRIQQKPSIAVQCHLLLYTSNEDNVAMIQVTAAKSRLLQTISTLSCCPRARTPKPIQPTKSTKHTGIIFTLHLTEGGAASPLPRHDSSGLTSPPLVHLLPQLPSQILNVSHLSHRLACLSFKIHLFEPPKSPSTARHRQQSSRKV